MRRRPPTHEHSGAPPVELQQARSPEDWRQARQLIEQYAASLQIDLGFQNIAHELAHLADEYSAPTGAFLIVRQQGAALGCAGLRRFAAGDGEIKRLYVIAGARGRGIGLLLARHIIAEAGRLGYARLLLDTLPAMHEAKALYAALGFKPMPAYRFNPHPGAAYFELSLS